MKTTTNYLAICSKQLRFLRKRFTIKPKKLINSFIIEKIQSTKTASFAANLATLTLLEEKVVVVEQNIA
jgi:hypothetical protein